MHEQDMVDKERKANQRQRVQDVDLEDLQDVRSRHQLHAPIRPPCKYPGGFRVRRTFWHFRHLSWSCSHLSWPALSSVAVSCRQGPGEDRVLSLRLQTRRFVVTVTAPGSSAFNSATLACAHAKGSYRVLAPKC